MPMRMRTIALPTEPSFRVRIAVAAAAAALALFTIPHQAHAQGVFNGMERGANQGAYEGHRAAGPVGGAIGGAIGAGVGGAVGGVNGVLGIPDRGYRRGHRCRGYWKHGHFHCYR